MGRGSFGNKRGREWGERERERERERFLRNSSDSRTFVHTFKQFQTLEPRHGKIPLQTVPNSRTSSWKNSVTHSSELSNSVIHNFELSNSVPNSSELSNFVIHNSELSNSVTHSSELSNFVIHNFELSNSVPNSSELSNCIINTVRALECLNILFREFLNVASQEISKHFVQGIFRTFCPHEFSCSLLLMFACVVWKLLSRFSDVSNNTHIRIVFAVKSSIACS